MTTLPAQWMFEHFIEKLADGTLKAEPLPYVVNLFEERKQNLRKPEPSRQYNLQLDSKLTITTERRHVSSEPTNEKGWSARTVQVASSRIFVWAVEDPCPMMNAGASPARSTEPYHRELLRRVRKTLYRSLSPLLSLK